MVLYISFIPQMLSIHHPFPQTTDKQLVYNINNNVNINTCTTS